MQSAIHFSIYLVLTLCLMWSAGLLLMQSPGTALAFSTYEITCDLDSQCGTSAESCGRAGGRIDSTTNPDGSVTRYCVDPSNDPGSSGGNSTGQNPTQGGNESGQNPDPKKLVNPLSFNSIEDFLVGVIEVILVFARPLIVLFIMYAGFLYVTAGGDESKVTKARTALTWAVVGGLIVLGATIIMEVIQGTIGAF